MRSLLPVIVSAAGIAVALSMPLSASAITKRDGTGPGVYVCFGQNWTGMCDWVSFGSDSEAHNGKCFDAVAGHVWQVSSFGPDKGLQCYVHDVHGCGQGGHKEMFQYPGTGNLGFFPREADSGETWDQSIASFWCQKSS